MNNLTLRTDRSLVRAASRSTRYVIANIVAPVAPRTTERPPLDVAFVIDRSGSMGGDKIVRAREAVLEGIGMLGEKDRFAVVSFDDRVEVVVPLTKATHAARQEAEARVRTIEPRGSTNLGEGWVRGCQQLIDPFDRWGKDPRGYDQPAGRPEQALARCILLSDGQANQGITDRGELSRLAADWRQRGIVTSTLGVGADFDEELMTGMSRAGGGAGYFIRESSQVGDLLTSIIGEALEVVASDVALVVDAPAGMDVQVLGSFQATATPGGLRVNVGPLVSGQELPVVLEVRCPTGTEGESSALSARLEDRDGALGTETVNVSWTFASHGANDTQPRDRQVDVAVARLYAAKARQEALALNRDLAFKEAAKTLERVAGRIERYAGDCRELRDLVKQLRQEAREFGRRMDPMARKLAHYGAHAVLSSRMASGKAMRTVLDAEQFPLVMVKGVPAFRYRGRLVLVDTGSPVSFGKGPLAILGESFDLPEQFGPVSLEDVSRAAGCPIDILLGGDLLKRFQWLVDVPGGRVVVSQGELPCDGPTLRTPTLAGVPLADVTIAGHQGRAVVDTGARLTYVDAAVVSGQAVGHEHDFHPALGAFETDVYALPVEVGGQRFVGRVGEMPPALQPVLRAVGARWIAGMDVLGQHPFVLDLGHGRIKIVLACWVPDLQLA